MSVASEGGRLSCLLLSLDGVEVTSVPSPPQPLGVASFPREPRRLVPRQCGREGHPAPEHRAALGLVGSPTNPVESPVVLMPLGPFAPLCQPRAVCEQSGRVNRSGRLAGGPQVLGPGPHGLPCGRSTRVCWGLRPVAAGLARGLQLLWFRLPAAQRGRREEATAAPAILSQSWSPAPAPGDPRLGALPDAVLKSTRDDTHDGLWPVKCCACERAATPAWAQGY